MKLKISLSGSSFDLNRARAKVETARAGVSVFRFASQLASKQNASFENR